jgi:hypothetical protein
MPVFVEGQQDYIAKLNELWDIAIAASGGGAIVATVSGTAPIQVSGTSTNRIVEIAPASTVAAGSMSAADKTKLDSITPGASNYTLPIAAAGTLGGVRIGANLSIDPVTGIMSATVTGGGGGTVTTVSVTAPLSVTNPTTTPALSILPASQSAAGSMSAFDKAKLDNIPASIGDVTVTGSQTLTNKQLTNVALTEQTLTDGASIAWNAANGQMAQVTLLGSGRVIQKPTNLRKGIYTINIDQDGVGNRTYSFASGFRFTATPAYSTAAYARDSYMFISDGADLYGSLLTKSNTGVPPGPPPPEPNPEQVSPFAIGVNVHFGGSSTTENTTITNLLKARNIRRIRMDLIHDAGPWTLQRDFIQKVNANGGKVEVTLQISFQWNNTVYTSGQYAAIEQQAYNETYACVNIMKDLIHDYELLNEVSLRPECLADVPLNSGGATADAYIGKDSYESLARVLKGMADAIHAIGTSSGLPLRVILGAVGRDFGMINFMQLRGVNVDVIGYHNYSGFNQESLLTDPWYGTGGPLTRLAAFGKPVTYNEFNAAEIYDAAYNNTVGQTLTENGYKSIGKHLKDLYGQTIIPELEAVCLYELLDEPAKPAPENRFGILYNLTTPKVALYITTAFAGGALTTAERAEITSRNILTNAEIDAMQAVGTSGAMSALFSSGQEGAWFEAKDRTSLLKLDLITPVSADGDLVKKILDKSGRAHHMVESSQNTPIFRITSPNNRDAFHIMEPMDQIASGGGGTGGFFFAIAFRNNGWIWSTRTIFSDMVGNTGYRFRIGQDNQLSLEAGNGSSIVQVLSTPWNGLANLTDYVLMAWHDPVDNKLRVQVDQNAPNVSTNAVVTAAGSAGWYFGGDTTPTYLDGWLYGAVYRRGSALTSNERESVRAYLASLMSAGGTAPPPSGGTAPNIVAANWPSTILQTGNSNDAYWVHDNAWNPGTLTRGTYTGLNGSQYEQYIGVHNVMGPNGEVAFRMAWEWPTGTTEVKGYPSVISGAHPGWFNTSPNPGGIPIRLLNGSNSTIAPSGPTPGTFMPKPLPVTPVKAAASYVHNAVATGHGQLAYDIWLQSNGTQINGFGNSPITHEIMIQLTNWGDYGTHLIGRNPGWYSHDTTIDGRLFHVYANKDANGVVPVSWWNWKFIVFQPDQPIPSGTMLNIEKFINYCTTRVDTAGTPWANGSEWMMSIELGVEPVDGTGDITVFNYRVWQ